MYPAKLISKSYKTGAVSKHKVMDMSGRLSHEEFERRTTRLFERTLATFDGYFGSKKKGAGHGLAALHVSDEFFPVLKALSKSGTLQIFYFLMKCDRLRFNELGRLTASADIEKLKHLGLGKLSSRTLSMRLHELAKAGVVERKRYSETPPRVEYSITKKGRELRLPLAILYWWSLKWADGAADLGIVRQSGRLTF